MTDAVLPLPPRVDVVIVNWNTGDQLRRCLESIASLRTPSVVISRVVVVDNASRDGSAAGLHDLPLPLTVLCNPRNVGFAAACNQGAAASQADFLLFLNPDTLFLEDALTAPVQLMLSPEGRDIGICGIRLVDADGGPTTVAARFPGVRVIVGEATGLGRVLPARFPRHLLAPDETRVSRDVDQVIGAFFLMRRPLFERLGGFDERFFVYYEEVDLALRARQAGFRSHLLVTATAVHHGGLSSEQVRARRLFYTLRSRLLYVGKHQSLAGRVLVYAVTLGIEPWVRLAHAAIATRSLDSMAEIIKAYVWLLTDRPFLSRQA